MRFNLEQALQARIAFFAIGRSTLRNQGSRGMVKAARHFLRSIDLSHFAVRIPAEFDSALDRHTLRLMTKFPGKGRTNWGAARKSMNIFLRDVVYSHHLREHFQLSAIEPWLELPLDSYSYLGLAADAKRLGLISEIDISRAWPGVKGLKGDVNALLQGLAKAIAMRLGTLRIHLDIRYWQQRGL